MRIIHDILIDKKVKKDSRQFIKLINPNGCTIESVNLGGSHTKNTSNADSDIDLTVYYKIPLREFLRCDIKTPFIDCENVMDENSQSTTWLFKDRKFEVNFVPLKKNTSFKHELAKNLIQPNIHALFMFYKEYPLVQTETMKKFRNWIFSDVYYLKPESIFGYFDGYMVSQLQRHRRRKDGKRRMLQARKLNSVTPIVKLSIDGIYMGLSGMLMLEEQAVSRNVKQLVDKYAHLFEKPQMAFIDFCIDHKVNRTPPDMETWNWIDCAMDMRDELFEVLHKQIEISFVDTEIEFSDWMRRENKKSIESWLMNEFYKGEV